MELFFSIIEYGAVAIGAIFIIRRYYRVVFTLLKNVILWLLVPAHIRRVIEIGQIIYQVSKDFGLLKGDLSKADHLAAVVGAGVQALPPVAAQEVQARINDSKGILRGVTVAIDDKKNVASVLNIGNLKITGGWNPLNGDVSGGVGVNF